MLLMTRRAAFVTIPMSAFLLRLCLRAPECRARYAYFMRFSSEKRLLSLMEWLFFIFYYAPAPPLDID